MLMFSQKLKISFKNIHLIQYILFNSKYTFMWKKKTKKINQTDVKRSFNMNNMITDYEFTEINY